MPLQTNIHPIRWLAACFGVQWDGPLSPETFKSALPAVAQILGVTEAQIIDFFSRALNRLQEKAPQLADPQTILVIDAHTEQAILQVQEAAKEIGDVRLHECADRFTAWLEARLRIPADDIVLLQHYIYLEWMLRIYPDKFAGAIIRIVQITMFGLLEKRPAEFRQALKDWKPILDPMTPEGRTALQAHGRIMHGVFCSIRERTADDKAARHRIQTLLAAWREAYETSISDACQFLYAATRRHGRANSAKKTAGVIFNELVRWFHKAGLNFPFYEKLVTVRNKLSHRPWSIDDARKIVFFGLEGAPGTVALTFDEIEHHVMSDVWTAAYFSHGVLMAVLEHDNQAGKFDAAWARFISIVGDATNVFDETLPANDLFGTSEDEEEDLDAAG